MDVKKKPQADVGRYRGMLLNLGFVIAIAAVLTAFKWKSYPEIPTLGVLTTTIDDPITMPVTEIPPPPKPVIKQPVVVEVEDDEEIEMENFEIIFDPVDEVDLGNIMEEPEPEPDAKEFWEGPIEKNPTPVGGMDAFNKFLRKNLKYPPQARRMNVSGKVFVRFIVGTNGELTDVEVLKGIGSGCDEEAIRVIKAHPNWEPGEQRGRPVKVRMVIPIFFQLGR